jgi:cytochrome c-type biogenesis protein
MIDFGPAAFIAAFAAGFVSFLSPCVFPLVPGYLSLVSGVSVGDIAEQPRRVTTATAAFVGGFTATFVAFGAGAAVFGNVLLTNRRTLEIVAGVFIVFAGAVFAGLPLPLSLLREKRVHVDTRRGVAAPGLIGLAFGVGWTPCIGPTLAAILALAASGGSAGQGALLLAVYSIGLGIPFLLFGLAFTRALGLVSFMRRNRRVISLGSGVTMMVFGVLIATGTLTRLTTQLTQFTGVQI